MTRSQRLLNLIVDKLEKESWGNIQPRWLDPAFIKDTTNVKEEVLWARDLQKIFETSLKELDSEVEKKKQ